MTATIKDARKSLGTVETYSGGRCPVAAGLPPGSTGTDASRCFVETSNRLPGASSRSIIRGKQEDTH